ncbi:hypothetical protein G3576_18715 [Roseomonas stagni]|uniref:Uncharacterized protein n=1 Tax=Falsiroseomonas algicola TaxID=2716930 RepID=A0A6M1LQN4_9PROT|nr:hypothetical protein [Falsiroseomonas algicola]NGM22064.1 hypothetical protein [Falsiroseomonas algicola]
MEIGAVPIPLPRARPWRHRLLVIAASGLAALPGTAVAQYREVRQGQKGAAQILRIDENGRFNRCAAHITSSAGPLRISWNRDHVYNISTPAVPVNGRLFLRLLDTPAGTFSFDATTNGQRVSARIDTRSMEAVLRIRGRIKLQVGSRNFDYALGNASMQDIIVEVENCTHRAMGHG